MLTDALPESVEVVGTEYRIHTVFRDWIRFELMMLDDEIDEEDKVGAAFSWYIDPPPVCSEAIIALVGFYRGRSAPVNDVPGGSGGAGGPVYSFAHDDAEIFAAFWQQYRIDLSKAELHWWAFKALFAGLGEDCRISQIMGYRGADLNELTGAMREQYRMMQERYALPRPKREQEKVDAITAALMGCGDLDGML